MRWFTLFKIKWIALLVLVLVSVGLAFALYPKQQRLVLSGVLQGQEVKNASSFGGRVTHVWVNEGDEVVLGQPMLSFEDKTLRSQIDQAQASLNQAKAKQTLVSQSIDNADREQAVAQLQEANDNLSMVRHALRPEELTQAQAQVAEAKTQLNYATQTLQQANTLLQQGVIAQQQLSDLSTKASEAKTALSLAQSNLQLLKQGSRPEQIGIAQAHVNVAKAQANKVANGPKPAERQLASAGVQQAKSLLDGLKAQLSETVLKAPISGMVSVLSVAPGELVLPNKPIVAILNHRQLWSDLYMPESALNQVRLGQTVVIKASVSPKARFTGKVAFINPKSEFVPGSTGGDSSEQASFRVKVEVLPSITTDPSKAPPFRLLPGMKVDVYFPNNPSLRP
jgi:HlyD family secretion protein